MLSKVLRLFELPLLAKELNEQAARKRTYIVRFAYAALLFVGACGLFYGNFLQGGNGSARGLGQGKLMFEKLVKIQFVGIYLFVPAISCSCLAAEKERNTLGLLLITSLTPWQIVLQKLLGRLVPLLTFVILSFPLMAVAYSFGGITEDYLFAGIVLLLLTCVQAAALAVMCSAYYPTTVESLIANYVLFLVLFFMLPFGWGMWLFENASAESLGTTLASTTLLVLMTAGFLVAARLFVEARAFVPPKNVLLGIFQKLDQFFNEANTVTGGIVLIKDGDPLPGAEPVAWRETTKKSLGTFRYLFRVLVVLELPLLFVCQSLQSLSPGGPDTVRLTQLLYGLWVLAGAMIIVHAGSVIASERTRQTLDVLLATPMSGAEILRQKMGGVRRLIKVLLVPFITIFAFETWWHHESDFRWFYLALSLGAAAIYLPLLAWIALWVGMRVRSQIKAVVGTMGLVAAWLLLPMMVRAVMVSILDVRPPLWVECLFSISPAEQIAAIEGLNPAALMYKQAERWQLWLYVALITLNFGLYGWLFSAVRRHCLGKADTFLGRSEPPVALAEPPRTVPEFEREEELAPVVSGQWTVDS